MFRVQGLGSRAGFKFLGFRAWGLGVQVAGCRVKGFAKWS